jgi:hypothetical protein
MSRIPPWTPCGGKETDMLYYVIPPLLTTPSPYLVGGMLLLGAVVLGAIGVRLARSGK